MDLFDYANQSSGVQLKPLAERMRARSIGEFVGQSHIVAENSLLRRAIKLDRVGSCIFWGPPGCGKTTLAGVIANSTAGNIIRLNAVSSGVSDIKKAGEQAENDLKMYGKKTYLLLDECHRFSKTQSDSLLPLVEQGTLYLIGSTTENPYASMTSAIVSRCRVFEFHRLTEREIYGALIRAKEDEERGLGKYDLTVDEDAYRHIARASGGDLRTAYNALELAALTTPPRADGSIVVTLADAEQSIQQKALSFNEDQYYDILSAFCKSLRGSDSSAALYYCHRLIQGGCDPMLLARRLVVHASEDVGMADPNALVVATAAMTALQNIGLPEALLNLSHAIIYVCEAPKSPSVKNAMYAAIRDVKEVRAEKIPLYLRDWSFASSEDKKNAANYKYPHDYGGYVKQQYLPDEIKDRVYYVPTENGYEKVVRQNRKDKGQE